VGVLELPSIAWGFSDKREILGNEKSMALPRW
jgi:hypothetical protein